MNQPLLSADADSGLEGGHPHSVGLDGGHPHSPGTSAAPSSSRQVPWWRRALPFALALAFVAVTLHRVDLRVFVRHLRAVNAPAFLAFAVVFMVALLTADAFATARVYRRTVAPVSFRELWILRGASYLPSILSHHLGQALLTYYLSRRYGVTLARMAGGTILVYASWAGLLLAVGAGATLADGKYLQPALILAVGVAYLAVIAWRPAFLARTKLLAPLFEAGLGGHLSALAVRLPHFLVLFAGSWAPFAFFGVKIPLVAALAYMPILMVAVVLPITPQGVGTRDLVAAHFFACFAQGATSEEQAAVIAAATTSWAVAVTLVQAVLGLLVLKRALPALEARAAAEG
jgi:hypothetical protein